MKRIAKILFKTIFALVVFVILLLGVVVLALQFPSVQTKLAEKATQILSEKTGFQHSVARVNVKWPNAISLEGVLIKDRHYRPMIEVGSIAIQHDFWPLLKKIINREKIDLSKGLILNEAMLYKPNVWLVSNEKTGQININEWVDALANLSPPDTTQTPTVPFGVKNIQIIDGVYRMDDPRYGYMKGKVFDHNHFTIKDINGRADNLYLLGDTLTIDVKGLKAVEARTDLAIKKLDTRFFMCDHKMELGDLDAHVGNSVAQNYFALHYKSFDDFDDFNNKVVMRASLKNTSVHSSDLGYFSDYIKTLNENWKADGDFEGTVQDFKYNGRLAFGKDSRIDGRINFKNVLDYQHAKMNFDLKSSRIATSDFHQYYPDKKLNDQLKKLGTVDIAKGKFDGTIDNFVVSGNYKTALGNADGSLKLDLRPKIPTYDANIKTEEFDLGTLLDDTSVGKIALDGRIKGRGFSIKDAEVVANAKVPKFTYEGYTYRNVVLNGNLQKKWFEGAVSVNDPNLVANVDGNFDFSHPTYVYLARGRVEKADLRALKLMKDSLTLHTDLEVDMRGNSIDELAGSSKFLNSYAYLGKRALVVDTLLIDSKLMPDSTRRLAILSEFLNFGAVGKFKPTVAVADLAELIGEYGMAFVGGDTLRKNYYTKKITTKPNDQRYNLDYTVAFKKVNKLLAFLYPEGFISEGSKAEGSFTMDKAAMFTFEGEFDTLKIKKYDFFKNKVDINTSKFRNSTDVLAAVNFTSKGQKLGDFTPTEKLDMEASWEKDHIEFRSKIKQKNQSNRATLNGDLRFIDDRMELSFKKSKLQLLENEWNLAKDNLITIAGGELDFKNVVMNNKDQFMAINGKISTDSLQALNVEAKNVELATFNPLLTTKISGLVNGKLQVRDLYKNSIYESNSNIAKFIYNGQEIGDITAEANWDPIDRHLHVDTHLDNQKRRVIGITGVFDPNKKGNELDLVAKFDNSDIKMLNGFTEGLISEIGGTANGEVKIKGDMTSPKLAGEVKIQKGRMTFDYLKANFAFEDKLYFEDQQIEVKNMKLSDPEGNVATFKGTAAYGGSGNYLLDFNAQLKNFKVLNTTIRDNEVFYGTAYASGRLDMWGPINNLTIKPTLTSNKGTKIYIPLDGATEVASQDFVQFVAPPSTEKDSVEATPKEEVSVANFKLDMQLNMTPDAYCEILFDRQAGHALSGNGQGLLSMGYDTRVGDFTMAGNYEMKNGIYNFSNSGISKKLQIQPGGRISWTGDPYEATIDIKATYTARTSLSPIITSGQITDNRRYPIEISMALTDKLTQPQTTADLKFTEYPSQYSLDVQAMESEFKRDYNSLFNQVLALMIFNQLMPRSASDFLFSNTNGGTNALNTSASEIITSQLNKVGSSFGENFEVGVSGFDASKTISGISNGSLLSNKDILNNLQLRFSYSAFNGRVRFTRDSRLSYGNGSTAASNLLLDWTVELWLTPDGSQRLKGFSRNLQNQFSLTSAGAAFGVSIFFSKSFNHFYELSSPDEQPKKPIKPTNDLTQADVPDKQ